MKKLFIILLVCLLAACAGTLILQNNMTEMKKQETALIAEQEKLQTELSDAQRIAQEKEEAIRQKEETVQPMKEEYETWKARTEEIRSYLP